MSNVPTITLASGRIVRLDRLVIEDTYLEVEGGTPEERRNMLLDIPYERVATLSDDDAPYLLIEPPPGDLPALTFIAQLSSEQPVKGGEEDAWSELSVCWYADAFPADLLAYVTERVRGVDWDAHAGNFEW